MSKPLVIYIDDEPNNLTVFEAAMAPEWDVLVFDSPLKALEELTNLQPWVVASDQRMPGMVGVKFLEIVKKTHPHTKRVLITGYSEEDLVIDSVRKAGIHDYIRKPWDVDDLSHRISKMIETYQLETDLALKTSLLEQQNTELTALARQLEKANMDEQALRRELEAWAPPFILSALQDPSVKFPLKRDLALITFDIIDSSKTHDLFIENKLVRSIILQEFSESVIKHGGIRESHSGDSAYAHFGLLPNAENPARSALAVAREFRSFLRNLSSKHQIQIECGIGLHFAKNILINVHMAEILTHAGKVVQKSFDSSSTDVDLVHRIEHLMHLLPGSNVALSEAFVTALQEQSPGLTELGFFKLKGQNDLCRIYIQASDKLDEHSLNSLKQQAASSSSNAA